MKTSNKALALEWTLACTGLKLCPPFNTRSSEGTIGTLDTALNRSRRSTIHCNKRGLCAEEVTWKRTDKTPFMNPACKRHPCRALPWKLRFQMIIVEAKGRLNPTKGYRSDITRVSYFNGHHTKSRMSAKTERCAWKSKFMRKEGRMRLK